MAVATFRGNTARWGGAIQEGQSRKWAVSGLGHLQKKLRWIKCKAQRGWGVCLTVFQTPRRTRPNKNRDG